MNYTYPRQVFHKIRKHSDSIRTAADILDLPPTMLAAAIAEEIDDHEQRFKPVALLRNQIFDAFTARFATHSTIIADINGFLVLPPGDHRLSRPRFWHKLRHVALRDVGLGNVRILTAHQLLFDYADRHPDEDPLSLKHYTSDMSTLVIDLVHFRNGIQAKFAGLMVREAWDWFSQRAPEMWGAMSDPERTGLTTTYYNLGHDRIRERWQNATNDGVEPYQPRSSADGLGSVANYDKLSHALDLTIHNVP